MFLTYAVNSREELVRDSEPDDSWPVVEDDRDLLVSGLADKELFSLTFVNSVGMATAAFMSCCLLWRRTAKLGSDCLLSYKELQAKQDQESMVASWELEN